MSRPESEKAKLATYREMMNELLMRFGVVGRHAIVIAHNAATNRAETTTAFVNQMMSISELLKAGWGVELDIHWDAESQSVRVCHSPTSGCMAPLLDDRPFDKVFAEIATFAKSNPKLPIILDFEFSGIGFFKKDSPQFKLAIKKFVEITLTHFLPEEVRINNVCAPRSSPTSLSTSFAKLFRKLGTPIFAIEGGGYTQNVRDNVELAMSESKQKCLVPPEFYQYEYDFKRSDGVQTYHKASAAFALNATMCRAISKVSSYPSNGLPTSYDTSLGAVIRYYDEGVIDELLKCGIRSFKFDYVQQCDARQLQVDRFNLERMLIDLAADPEAMQKVKEALAQNHELTKTATYPFPTNSAFLAPLIGKPMADLETLFAAAKYYTGIETEEYRSMCASSVKKYAYHSPVNTFLSAAAFGALRAAISKVDAPGWRHYASLGLTAALTAGDLYLYSQSAVPLGAGLLAATAAEKMGCPQTAVTALKYGTSTLVGMALDPGASIAYTFASNAAGMLGGAAGTQTVNLVVAPMARLVGVATTKLAGVVCGAVAKCVTSLTGLCKRRDGNSRAVSPLSDAAITDDKTRSTN